MVLSKQWRLLGSGAALGATALIATIVWLTFSGSTSPARGITYQTGVGEQRKVTLADGSIIELNSDTWISVSFDSDTRKIALSRGEAYFQVTKEERPFQVTAGSGVVSTQTGTFLTQIDGDKTVVSVAEGPVTVHPQKNDSRRRIITALQKTLVTDHTLGNTEQLSQVEPDWRDGWLEFEDKPLSYVVAELEKYYRGRIMLKGEGVPQLRVSARFRIADIDTAIRILAKSMKLEMSIADTGDVTFFPQEE